MHTKIEIAGDTVLLEGTVAVNSPIVLLNIFDEDLSTLYDMIHAQVAKDFLLVGIVTKDWNAALSPWPDDQFAGQAPLHLKHVMEDIIPTVESQVGENHPWMIAGYSMAGLFATWAVTQTNFFKGVASVSGSLWYPNMVTHLSTAYLQLERAYFSLGRKERKARNRKMAQVSDATQAIVEYFQSVGIPTVFEWNEGNHFHEPTQRLAKGIQYLLK